MSNNNNSENTLGNHENQIHQNQGDLQNIDVVPSPQNSPRQSREGTPAPESRADQQEQSEHFEGADEALQKVIDARVSKALQALVSRLPVAPSTPTPNNNT